MQELKINSSNFSYMFSGLFVLVSTIFIIISVFTGYSTIKTKINCDTYTTASKVEINAYRSSSSGSTGGQMMYSPVFFYNVDGKEYSCSSRTASSIKPNTDNNKIYYKSQNPDYCISDYDIIQSGIISGLMLIIALPIFIFGLYMLICVIIGKSKIERLRKNGQLIKGIPCKILPSNSTLNNQRGYIIEVEYEGSILKSNTKYSDKNVENETADLLIDPLDAKNYFIDFDITQS